MSNKLDRLQLNVGERTIASSEHLIKIFIPKGKIEDIENLDSIFSKFCKEEYLEWIDLYRKEIHTLENNIKRMKKSLKDHSINHIYNTFYQSCIARMGNQVTKLIFIRRAGKSYRRKIILELKQASAA